MLLRKVIKPVVNLKIPPKVKKEIEETLEKIEVKEEDRTPLTEKKKDETIINRQRQYNPKNRVFNSSKEHNQAPATDKQV